MASQGSALFVNTMMGWPMVPSADLYAGGPAYPLSSPGIRLRAQASSAVTVLAGVFDDNPPGGPFADDFQLRGVEASGARFNLNTGALIIGEIQYGVNQPAVGDMAREGQSEGCQEPTNSASGTTPPISPINVSTAQARRSPCRRPAFRRCHQGNYSLYGVADQTVWHPDPQGSAIARALRPRHGRAARSQSDRVQRQCRREFLKRRCQAAITIHSELATGWRWSAPAPVLSTATRFWNRHAHADPFQRAVHRDHLPGAACAVVAGPTRFPIRLQSRRRNLRPKRQRQAGGRRGRHRRQDEYRLLANPQNSG